jgi:hypothetical protein
MQSSSRPVGRPGHFTHRCGVRCKGRTAVDNVIATTLFQSSRTNPPRLPRCGRHLSSPTAIQRMRLLSSLPSSTQMLDMSLSMMRHTMLTETLLPAIHTKSCLPIYRSMACKSSCAEPLQRCTVGGRSLAWNQDQYGRDGANDATGSRGLCQDIGVIDVRPFSSTCRGFEGRNPACQFRFETRKVHRGDRLCLPEHER